MASKAPITNVVRLPTAARRKPNNDRYVAQFHEGKRLRAEVPWPGEYKFPHERKQEAEEAARPSLRHIERTPALIVAMCVFGALDDDRRRVALGAAMFANCMQPSDATRDALLLMENVAGAKKATAERNASGAN